MQAAVSSLACACIALSPTAAGAYNVRLEDVENENLQSGNWYCCLPSMNRSNLGFARYVAHME